MREGLMNQTKNTQHFQSMEGKIYQLGRLKLAFKRTEGEGEGPYSVFEQVGPRGSGAGQHRHPSFQETFIVCEGHFDFEVSGERRSLGPGEMLIVPRGAPHGFTCTSEEPGRLLIISTPAGIFEAFIADVCDSRIDSGTPTGGSASDMRAIGDRHGVEFL
jgi:quercetin dioxygenase-like cupin family protein